MIPKKKRVKKKDDPEKKKDEPYDHVHFKYSIIFEILLAAV
jgi:hypothetical protein